MLAFSGMSDQHGEHGIDLAALALDDLHKAGFRPEFSPAVATQVQALSASGEDLPGSPDVPDLRNLRWSSIDNDTSRDLDQIEVAEELPAGIRIQVAIADVASFVPKDSPLDEHASAQTQTVYTAVRNFPMLPLELSTGLTSLNEAADRLALLMTFTVGPDGTLQDEQVSRALVKNRAQLAYSRVGPWLQGATSDKPQQLDPEALRSDSAPRTGSEALAADANGRPVAGTSGAWLADQLRLQEQATTALHKARIAAGALEFERAEADPVVLDGRVAGLHETVANPAMHLIEELMVAANGVMARALRSGGRSSLQRVVRVPQRWDRIAALAQDRGTTLASTPDPVALNAFLQSQRATDPDHYPDLALAVIKLMGAGEYMLMRAEDDPTGHFGLAARDYAHSTAPNRRFPDLVTQRILHAMLQGAEPPYTNEELAAIADHCNEADKALRKIDRAMQKRVAAVAMSSHIGQIFPGVVTGASPKGVYVRVLDPPFEGRIVQGDDGLDVGARVRVKLIHTDPLRAFIDFARVAS